MNTFPDQIFKSYDIRALDEELSDEIIERVGRAFVAKTSAKTVVVGQDMRPSSPRIAKSIKKGIKAAGANIIDIGMVTTPMLNFAIAMNEEIEGGIMVTASHNPPGWNGLKLMDKNAIPIGKGGGMEEIQEKTKQNTFKEAKIPGKETKKDTKTEFLNKIFEYTGEIDTKQVKIVADAGNGMAGTILEEVFKRVNANLYPLFFNPDGNFPNHEANPLKTETLKDLQKKVIETKAIAGFAYDADGDRMGLVDEKGKIVPGDIIGALLAIEILNKDGNGTILGNVQCGRDLEDAVKQSEGKYILTTVGHANIKKLMNQENAKLGIELSAHFYFKDFWNVESVVLATLLVIKQILKSNKPLSEIVKTIQKRAHSGEVNFKVENKEEIMQKIKNKYKKEAIEIIEIDGIRLEFKDWWLGIRKANTEPVLRLNLETKDKKTTNQKLEEIKQLIKN